jgi:hypothetical protein
LERGEQKYSYRLGLEQFQYTSPCKLRAVYATLTTQNQPKSLVNRSVRARPNKGGISDWTDTQPCLISATFSGLLVHELFSVISVQRGGTMDPLFPVHELRKAGMP